MTDHRVGSLRLHLRAHGSPSPELEPEARGFAEMLLSAVAERIDARANGKLVLLRRLPIRIRARRELFADRAEIERIADNVATSIPLSAAATPAEHDDVAIFDDEVEWRAAYLVELAHGRSTTAWWFSSLTREPDGIGGLGDLPHADAKRVLVRLARANALVPLLARSPMAAVEQLAVALEIAPLPTPIAAQPAALAASLRAELVHSIVEHVTGDEMTPVASVMAPGSQPSIAQPAPVSGDTTDAANAVSVRRTRYGGLVYLVRCLLELDAGEILWRACVPEPAVIAAALASVTADFDDPAVALLGGASPRERFAATPAQRDEIVRALATSLASALPRRGLVTDAEIALHFIEGAHPRMLAAFLGDWPTFAAPAPTDADAARAIETLVGLWPTVSLVAALPIAELHARIETRAIELVRPLLLRNDLDVDSALLVAVTAGCAAALVHARAVDLAIAGNARIHDEGDQRIVTMAMESIDLRIRRAGLDRNPGWVPWLQRHVMLVFEE